MTDDKTRIILDNAIVSILNRNLAKAFGLLRRIGADLGSDEIKNDVEKTESRYFYLLRFIRENNAAFSPEKDILDISEAAMNIAAQASGLLLEADSRSPRGAQLRFERLRPEENFESVVSDFLSELSRLRKDTRALTDTRLRSGLERLGNDIFKRIWAAPIIAADEERLIDTLIHDSDIPEYFRVQTVAAIGLGVEITSLTARIRLLDSAMTSSSRRIAITAEVWKAIAAAYLLRRDIAESLPHIATVYHAAVSAATPAARPQMPNLMDLGRRMQNGDLRNPDLKDSDYDAMRSIAEAQSRGEDVFGDTIGRMRHFPFFTEIANWFVPFHSDNSALADIVDGEGAAVADLIEKVPMLTDADKYSLLLSLSMMPAEMRGPALSQMVDQLHSMSGTEEFREAIEASELTETMLIGQTVNTIRRFFRDNAEGKRQGLGRDFDRVLLKIGNVLPKGFADFAPEDALVRRLADSGKAAEAVELFRALPPHANDIETQIAVARCLAETGNKSEARLVYQDVLELEPDNIEAILGFARITIDSDPLLVLALLDRKSDEFADNPEYVSLLGEAYLSMGDAEKAAETFHNLDYISSDDSAKGRLAWALTLIGDYDSADIYFRAATAYADEPDKNGLAVRHAAELWLSGKHAEAIDAFASVFKNSGVRNLDEFETFVHKSTVGLADYKQLTLPLEILYYRLGGTNA